MNVYLYSSYNPNLKLQTEFVKRFIRHDYIFVDVYEPVKPFIALEPNCYPLARVAVSSTNAEVLSRHVRMSAARGIQPQILAEFKKRPDLSFLYFGHRDVDCEFGGSFFCTYHDDVCLLRNYLETVGLRRTNYLSYNRVAMAFRFLKEWVKWNWGGRKLRSKEEMGALYTICEKCPFFQDFQDKESKESGGEGQCDVCGCNIKRTSHSMNKLAWNTTRCPHNPPNWF